MRPESQQNGRLESRRHRGGSPPDVGRVDQWAFWRVGLACASDAAGVGCDCVVGIAVLKIARRRREAKCHQSWGRSRGLAACRSRWPRGSDQHPCATRRCPAPSAADRRDRDTGLGSDRKAAGGWCRSCAVAPCVTSRPATVASIDPARGSRCAICGRRSVASRRTRNVTTTRRKGRTTRRGCPQIAVVRTRG